MRIANTNFSMERTTKSLQKINLFPNKGVKFWDTFGWGDEHFRNIFDLLLQGDLSDNYQLGESVEKYTSRTLYNNSSQIPHAVVMTFSAEDIDD